MVAIKNAIGYTDVYDYYFINNNETLGKGTSGSVYAGVHKKTGRKVAVKIRRKQDMDQEDIANLHRELNIMKNF